MKKIVFIFLLLTLTIFAPPAYAEDPPVDPTDRCPTTFNPLTCPIVSGAARCNTVLDPVSGCFLNPCTTCHLLALAGHILTVLIALAVLLSVCLFVYAGWVLLTTAIAEKISTAKKIFWNTFFGLIIILAAWLIVDTLLSVVASGGKRLNGATFDQTFCNATTNIEARTLCKATGFSDILRTAGPTTPLPEGTPVSIDGTPIRCSSGLCSAVGSTGLQVASVCRNGCVVRADVAEKLQAFGEALGAERSIWTTTSAFETGHANRCHTTHATCIDFAPSGHVATAENINAVIRAAGTTLYPVWELPDTAEGAAERDRLVASGVPRQNILLWENVRPHFSVYCQAGGLRDNDCDGDPSAND